MMKKVKYLLSLFFLLGGFCLLAQEPTVTLTCPKFSGGETNPSTNAFIEKCKVTAVTSSTQGIDSVILSFFLDGQLWKKDVKTSWYDAVPDWDTWKEEDPGDVTKYSFWLWVTLPVGVNEIVAEAIDSLGNSATTSISNITIFPNEKPVISLQGSGLDTGYVATSLSRTITLSAEDDGTVDSVALYLHDYNYGFAGGACDSLIGMDYTAPYEFEIDLEGVGSYAFKSKAWDNYGTSNEAWAVIELFESENSPRATGKIENNYDNGWIITRDWSPWEYLDGSLEWFNLEGQSGTVAAMWDKSFAKKVFYGTRLEVYANVKPGMKSIIVSVDGGEAVTTTLSAMYAFAQNRVALIEGLAPGFHTVSIKSSGDWIEWDYIVVSGEGSATASLTTPSIATAAIYDNPFYSEYLKITAADPDGIAKATFLINDGSDLWKSDDLTAPYEFQYWYTPKDGHNTFKVVIEDQLGNKDTIRLASFYVNAAPTVKYMKGLDQLIVAEQGAGNVSGYELKARGYDTEDTDADSLVFIRHTYGPDADIIVGGAKDNIVSVMTDLPVGTNVIKVKALDQRGRSSVNWAVVQVMADSIQNDTIENNAEGWMVSRDWNPAEHLNADSWNSVSNAPRAGMKVINLWDGTFAKRTFIGTKLQVIGVLQPGMGKLEISVDGVAVDTVDCNVAAGDMNAAAVLYGTESLTDKVHSVQLRKISGDWVEIDRLLVKSINEPVTGVADVHTESFSVYPNPATTVLNFSKETTVSLFNMQGQLVRTVVTARSMYIGDLANGSYLLRSSDQTTKLIIKL